LHQPPPIPTQYKTYIKQPLPETEPS
jgi:hypothetical protein